jgi:2-C-methyl-D-erythritol 4-phosphate cytidylyltransferase
MAATDLPKQYLPLLGRTVLEWSLAPLLALRDLVEAVVVIRAGDERFARLNIRDPRIRSTLGGAERADSVLKGLAALHAGDQDWVLVHDAARPCLAQEDLTRLIAAGVADPVGALLACPVTDTLKSADAGQHVTATVTRDRLWRAQTPQMFRLGVLRRALSQSPPTAKFTDDSAAVEALGLRPLLVAGSASNIKLTVPEDLALAEFLLRRRSS